MASAEGLGHSEVVEVSMRGGTLWCNDMLTRDAVDRQNVGQFIWYQCSASHQAICPRQIVNWVKNRCHYESEFAQYKPVRSIPLLSMGKRAGKCRPQRHLS